MSRVRARLARVPAPLALLLGVAAVLALSWSLATAPLQGPDESEHIGYVAHLAETGHIPSANGGGKGAYGADEAGALSEFGYGALLRNRQARPPWTPDAERRFRAFEKSLPAGAPGIGDGPTSVGKNPPLYYAFEAIGWRITPGGHFFGRAFMLRAFSGLLLLAFVAFTWLLAGEIFGRRRFAQTVAAGFVALLPMDGFMAGIVNTDIMLAAEWTAFAWLALRTVRLGLTWQRAAGLTAVSVASILTHGRGLAIVPALGVALLVAWLVHRKSLRETLKAAAGSVGVMVAGLVVYRLAFSTAVGSGSLYGGETNLGHTGKFNVRQMLTSIWEFYLPHLDSFAGRLGPGIGYRQIFVQQYFAGVFGSFEVYFPYWVYDTVQVLAAVIFIALYTAAAMRWRTVRANWPVVVILGALVVSLMALLQIASYRSLLETSGENPLIVGRYLVPLGGIFGVAIAALTQWLPRRAGVVVGTLVLVGVLTLSIAGLALSVERFYA
ncbi:MAG TPA: hypothetical protein VK501_21240 [Baekduia sp.]|uniref:hypothetical protein n=1 Tax=Baekduia sp. TaxID=2600305 RepID=UPI002CCD24FD|nr:hypothetical protein [Baekduia sp.]HMJ36442.1 hypothetical protein [Baekduia sp.]